MLAWFETSKGRNSTFVKQLATILHFSTMPVWINRCLPAVWFKYIRSLRMYLKSKNVSKVWLSKVVLTSMSTGFVIADFDRLKKQQESKAAENQLNSYDIRVRVPGIFTFVVQRHFNPTRDFVFALLNVPGSLPKILIWVFAVTAKWLELSRAYLRNCSAQSLLRFPQFHQDFSTNFGGSKCAPIPTKNAQQS